MKCITLSFFITLITVFSSCSSAENFKTISPAGIAFVHEDGSPIANNECINPNTNYAILIKTNSNGSGAFNSTKIMYTVNSILYITSFSSDGQQLKGIKLIDGSNVAEIVDSNYKASLYYNSHDNFELVP